MIVFSLQKNKLWNGSGFILKSGCVELSSMCFADQFINLGSGTYKIKLIGASISGNGSLSFGVFANDSEILSKQITMNSRSNTEMSFDIVLNQPGQYRLKFTRGKESIGRVSISFLTVTKLIEKQDEKQSQIVSKEIDKTYFIIDYDSITSPSHLSELFLHLERYRNCFFLVKTSDQFAEFSLIHNFRLFFEYSDLFDYLKIVNYKKLIYLPNNIEPNIFKEYAVTDAVAINQ